MRIKIKDTYINTDYICSISGVLQDGFFFYFNIELITGKSLPICIDVQSMDAMEHIEQANKIRDKLISLLSNDVIIIE